MSQRQKGQQEKRENHLVSEAFGVASEGFDSDCCFSGSLDTDFNEPVFPPSFTNLRQKNKFGQTSLPLLNAEKPKKKP